MIIKNLTKEIDNLILDRIILSFRTQKKAQMAGKKFGWNCALKINRRFETIWIVGKKEFQPAYIAGIAHDQYRIPLLRWERDNRGIEFCPVFEIEINQNKTANPSVQRSKNRAR